MNSTPRINSRIHYLRSKLVTTKRVTLLSYGLFILLITCGCVSNKKLSPLQKEFVLSDCLKSEYTKMTDLISKKKVLLLKKTSSFRPYAIGGERHNLELMKTFLFEDQLLENKCLNTKAKVAKFMNTKIGDSGFVYYAFIDSGTRMDILGQVNIFFDDDDNVISREQYIECCKRF